MQEMAKIAKSGGRMDSIRNAAKATLGAMAVGTVGAAAGSLYAGNDVKSSANTGAMAGIGGALGVLAGSAAPKLAGLGKSLMAGAKAGLKGKSFSKFGEDFSKTFSKTSFGSNTAMMMGGAMGAIGGAGYAVLNSNKPVQKKKKK